MGFLSISRRVVGAALLCLSGCGSGDQDEDEPHHCSLSLELSGAATLSRPFEDSIACGTNSTNSHFQIIYQVPDPLQEPLSTFALTVGASEGETGTLPAQVLVFAKDNAWETPSSGCTVTIAEHSLLRTREIHSVEVRSYLVRGTGSCAAEAEGLWDESRVTVGPFEFESSVGWSD
jgi:hypothetical protein